MSPGEWLLPSTAVPKMGGKGSLVSPLDMHCPFYLLGVEWPW